MKSSPSDAKPDELYGELASAGSGAIEIEERWRILYDTEPPPSSRCRAGTSRGDRERRNRELPKIRT